MCGYGWHHCVSMCVFDNTLFKEKSTDFKLLSKILNVYFVLWLFPYESVAKSRRSIDSSLNHTDTGADVFGLGWSVGKECKK